MYMYTLLHTDFTQIFKTKFRGKKYKKSANATMKAIAIPEALSLYCLCDVASSYMKPADPCFVLLLGSCALI